jgi:hypothetical protein
MRTIVLCLIIISLSALEYPLQIIEGNLIYIDGKSQTAMLIDTGATHSMISEKYASQNSLKIENKKGSITSFHGKTDSIRLFKGDVGIEGIAKLNRNWLVVDLGSIQIKNTTVVGVIGMDFLEKMDAKIDIKSKTISVIQHD